MSKSHDFLVEIGTEELPPKALKNLSKHFSQQFAAGLKNAEIEFKSIKAFATPRRLAVLVEQLADTQPDKLVERRGPSYKAAFTADGKPTKACLGFAESCGVAVEQLEILESDKGQWLIFKALEKGRSTKELLADKVRSAVANLPIPKMMRWADTDFEFVRPVHWVIMLFGSEVVEANILGQATGRETYGHRFHHPQAVSIKNAAEYEQVLRSVKVVADFEQRQAIIKQQIANAAKQIDAQAVVEQDLLDEVTSLVEWPIALLASFDREFLQVPAEALIAAMRDHQKYFHLLDNQQKLLPNFITIANIESSDPQQVIIGNERVMRARLSDAAFFYTTDCQQTLSSRIDATKSVVFQAKLGTLHDKIQRLQQLAANIAGQLGISIDKVKRAALLAKCDLLTEMVGEFPELQGIMGRYYAQHDQEQPEVAAAIQDHYLPRFAGDDLPASDVAAVLALTERLDTLVGIFGINQQPTGEKDPFKCRRAALGIIRILIEKSYDLDLDNIIQAAIDTYQVDLANKNILVEVREFIVERLRGWYHEQDIPATMVSAVLACESTHLFDIQQRLLAVQKFSTLNEASSLAAANKRVSRLLKKEGYEGLQNGVDNDLLQQQAEKRLAELIKQKQQQVRALYAKANYTQALTELASLREPIDQFFDEVMVMVDDEKLRNNRLTLLAGLRRLFLDVADISLLQQ